MNALTLEQANGRLEEIESRRAQLAALAAQNGNDLADAEFALGEAVLAGDDDAGQRVNALRLRADGFTAALAALEKRKAAALIEQKRATAADLHRQAQAKREELQVLEQKTAKHLQALSALEAVEYTACILGSQRAGEWFTTQGGYNTPAEWLGPLEVGRSPTNSEPFALPKSRRLRAEIEDLEGRALAIETELGIPEAAAE